MFFLLNLCKTDDFRVIFFTAQKALQLFFRIKRQDKCVKEANNLFL